jgi:hypothetical protein
VIAVHNGLRSQTLAKIRNTNISLDNDRIIITYDLVDAQPGEKFEVWLNITDAGGVLIQGRRFSGDIGNNIEGGEGLVIYWNFEEDNVTLSDEISIQVMAESLYKKELSYIKALALSTVVPGWGLAKMEDKKLYGLMGLAGYGFIAAGLVYTLNSKSTYKDYDNSNLIAERETLYNDYVSKKNTGEILGWSAAAIWVADIVWMSLRYGTSKDGHQASLSRRITTGFMVFPVSETPVFSMNIRF